MKHQVANLYNQVLNVIAFSVDIKFPLPWQLLFEQATSGKLILIDCY